MIIPIFIPHRGCPHQCSFCNQESITGQNGSVLSDYVKSATGTIKEWLERPHRDRSVEVAFYGGSFTCLPEDDQLALLDCVQPFMRQRRVIGIRLSTRPDCISHDGVEFIKSYGVKKIELGVQSLNDHVLVKSKRGHCVADVVKSVEIIKKAGLEAGVQLMAGLPGETTGTFLQGIDKLTQIKPHFVRLYPVVIVKNSELEQRYLAGTYTSLSMNKAVALSVRFYTRMKKANIPVIRIGLQPSVDLEKMIVAGPYHPSFGELVQSRVWLQKIRKFFKKAAVDSIVTLHISNRDLSSVQGLKKINIQRLEQLGLSRRFTIKTDRSRERSNYEFSVALNSSA